MHITQGGYFCIITKLPKTTPKWLSYDCYVISSAWYGECVDGFFAELERAGISHVQTDRPLHRGVLVPLLCSQRSFPEEACGGQGSGS